MKTTSEDNFICNFNFNRLILLHLKISPLFVCSSAYMLKQQYVRLNKVNMLYPAGNKASKSTIQLLIQTIQHNAIVLYAHMNTGGMYIQTIGIHY